MVQVERLAIRDTGGYNCRHIEPLFPPSVKALSTRGLTLRSLGIGLLLAFGVGAVVPFLGLYVQGSNSGAYFTSQIATAPPRCLRKAIELRHCKAIDEVRAAREEHA